MINLNVSIIIYYNHDYKIHHTTNRINCNFLDFIYILCMERGGFMSKIIKVSNEIVLIGLDDGSIQEVRVSDCEFDPQVGDEVEVFQTLTQIVVVKSTKNSQKKPECSETKGVNISINNGNNSTVPPAYPTGKVVNKLVYILLALFLGGIGAHKFYSGKYGMGIVYLVFFWTGIPALCAVVDLIIVCFKPSDQNGNIVI